MEIRLPTPRRKEISDWVWGIDSLINERLHRVTHRAVTKGVRRHSAYRWTGVRWVGEVPKNWKVARLAELASFVDHGSGGQPSGYYMSADPAPRNCTIPCVGLADVGHLQYNEKMGQFTGGHPAGWAAEPGHRVLPAGAVVLSTVSHVGYCAIPNVPAAISWPFVAWVPGPELLSEYLLFCLRAMGPGPIPGRPKTAYPAQTPELVRLTRPGPIGTLPLHSVRAFRVPVPPLGEQEEIVHHLERTYGHYRAVRERVSAVSERQGWEWRPGDSTGKILFRDSVPPAASTS